ncbi:MAG TPA: hypothetical protein VF453_09515 [Burkholderiaceae bacterium]
MELERLAALVSRQEGQIMALEIAVTALIATHPYREAVLQFFEGMSRARLDQHLATTLPEEMRDGIEQMRDQLLRTAGAPRFGLAVIPTNTQPQTPSR